MDGVRGLVEVAREPAMTLPLQRQAMMHPAMPSQLTEQTRTFTRCSREHLGIDFIKISFLQGAASSPAGSDDNIAMLEKAIPGVPGEDYPIYAEVPESGFTCDGQVDGGYYADPEAECQVFHICTADGAGGLAQYSFLCPNGTVFNQNYFICDWWFNFDCSEAEGLYSLNDEIAAEAAAAGAASDAVSSYAAPDAGAPIGGYDAPSDVLDDAQAAYGQAARNARNGRGPQQPFGNNAFKGGRRQGRRG